jgi:hypothetical protein
LAQLNLALLVLDGDYRVFKIQQVFALQLPPPIGTTQRSLLAANQFAVMIGDEVKYQPWRKL